MNFQGKDGKGLMIGWGGGKGGISSPRDGCVGVDAKRDCKSNFK